MTFTALDGVRALRTADVDRSCPRDTPTAPCEAALGVLKRDDGVDGSPTFHRGAPSRGGRTRAPSSKFHQYLRENVSDEVKTRPKSTKKPPTAIILRNDAFE